MKKFGIVMTAVLLLLLPLAIAEKTADVAVAADVVNTVDAANTVDAEKIEEIEEIDVSGFWFCEEDHSGIELVDGMALISIESEDAIPEGTYVLQGNVVTITYAENMFTGVIVGNSMTIESTGQIFTRDGIEMGYWNNDLDDSALELYDGTVWTYNEDGDVVSEGTYTIDGSEVTIQLEGKTYIGIIRDGEMTVDGVVYTLL